LKCTIDALNYIEYTTSTMKYTLNTSKCIEKRFKYFGVF
jgi:hypothetical protein